MQFNRFMVCVAARALVAALALTALSPAAMSADAKQKFENHYVYADGHGNLIVVKPGSYKQILVGQAGLAESIRKAMETPSPAPDQGRKPTIVYLNAVGGEKEQYRQIDASMGQCIGGATVLHGRAFMYGIPRNVTPVVNNAC
jgi:hypothetical protein